jgi:hypothetical protein
MLLHAAILILANPSITCCHVVATQANSACCKPQRGVHFGVFLLVQLLAAVMQ